MGKIADGLHTALEGGAAQLVQKQREQDGRGKAEQKTVKADEQRVSNQPCEIVG